MKAFLSSDIRAGVGVLVFAACLVAAGRTAHAHFVVLLPSTDTVSADDPRSVTLEILFTHPMNQGPVMEMAPPKQFGVVVGGKKHDLLGSLKLRKLQGRSTYTAQFQVQQEGDHLFYVEPAPYWEKAERKWIIHYTKVVVDSLGAEDSWDKLVGMPVEIEPLVRPYGLWTGNSFRGIVRHNGKPAPFARIEVEYYNQGKQVKVPSDAFTTQVIKADANGVFCYTMPRAGWWGFVALVDGPKQPGPDGKPADVELGGAIWVKTVDMQSAAKQKNPQADY
jgi:cobalt/nickel transport protein